MTSGYQPFRLLLALGLIASAAGCAAEPYPVSLKRQPPWQFKTVAELPPADPPFTDRAKRLGICYGWPLNDQDEVLAVAEERCPGGRLVVERRDAFWNSCGLFQPMRAVLICDPAAGTSVEDVPEAKSAQGDFLDGGVFDRDVSEGGIFEEETSEGEAFERKVQEEK